MIKESPGSSVNDLSAAFDVSRIAVMKHLRVLEEAQLIVLRKNGRRREIYFNVVPIQMIYDRWTSEYSSFWAAKAVDLKFLIEGSTLEPNMPTAKPAQRKRSS